jgi:hypothetical protein
LLYGSAQTPDIGDAERNGAAIFHGETRLEDRLLN